jgi:hypothetical protein
MASSYGDRYGAEWVRNAFERHHIELRHSPHDRSTLYLNLLPALSAGQAKILDIPRLRSQLLALERRTIRGSGRDKVDHPSGGADDLANAAAGALVMAATADRRKITWSIGIDRGTWSSDGTYISSPGEPNAHGGYPVTDEWENARRPNWQHFLRKLKPMFDTWKRIIGIKPRSSIAISRRSPCCSTGGLKTKPEDRVAFSTTTSKLSAPTSLRTRSCPLDCAPSTVPITTAGRRGHLGQRPRNAPCAIRGRSSRDKRRGAVGLKIGTRERARTEPFAPAGFNGRALYAPHYTAEGAHRHVLGKHVKARKHYSVPFSLHLKQTKAPLAQGFRECRRGVGGSGLGTLPSHLTSQTPFGSLTESGCRLRRKDQLRCSWRCHRYATLRLLAMTPTIKNAWPEKRGSRSSDSLQCWHVEYELCEVSAQVTVYARDETEARSKAAHQLRRLGLKLVA